jgi:hypothetical protein
MVPSESVVTSLPRSSITISHVRFQVLTAANMTTAFWDIGAYCLHSQCDEFTVDV